jgi:hypothetical protein
MVAILSPHPFFDGEKSVFEPDTITVMSTAFELACADLHVFAGDKCGREIIARRIIDLASKGTVDEATLHQRVVAEAGASV